VEIREATQDDVPAVRQLLQLLPGVWQDSWRADVIERAISSVAGLALVAVRGHILVGFACAHDFGFHAYLSQLTVSASEQNSGLGTQLLRRIEEQLGERGCSVLTADVHRPAEFIYRRLGWSAPAATLLRQRLG